MGIVHVHFLTRTCSTGNFQLRELLQPALVIRIDEVDFPKY